MHARTNACTHARTLAHARTHSHARAHALARAHVCAHTHPPKPATHPLTQGRSHARSRARMQVLACAYTHAHSHAHRNSEKTPYTHTHHYKLMLAYIPACSLFCKTCSRMRAHCLSIDLVEPLGLLVCGQARPARTRGVRCQLRSGFHRCIQH